MKAVSNASPLIALARIGHLASLRNLFQTVYISVEVHDEVVVAGNGLPGAIAVSQAAWIETAAVSESGAVGRLVASSGLGAGEASAIVLAKELGADALLMDERRGRRRATEQGLLVVGCVGVLEELHRRGHLGDLREAYAELLREAIRIDRRLLQASLKSLGISELPGL